MLKMSFNTNQGNEKYLQEIAVLQKFVLDIVEAKTWEELAKHVFDAIDATIDPATENIGQVRFGALWGFSNDRARGKDIELLADGAGMPLDGPGIMVRAINTGKVVNLPDTSIDPSYVDGDPYEHMYSEIAVPILVQGKSIGVINIEEFEANAFDESDQRILEALSRYVGVSLSNILYSNRLNGLHKYTSQLGKLTSIGEAAELTVNAMTDSLELELCAFLLNQDEIFQTIYEKGLEESIRRRETALKYFRSYAPSQSWREADNLEFLSELQIPIDVDGKVVAILIAKSIQPDKYTDQDKKLLEILASHVASTIQRIKFLEERERVQQELALERVRVEQANELDRMKNQFISTATHELRTPVTSIIGFLELVLEYSSEELPESVRKDLKVVFRNAMRLVDMTNDLLDVQRITSGRFIVKLEKVELINTLNEVVEELRPLFTDKQQTLLLNTPDTLMVNVDETRISQLFINLIRNANKFTPERGNIKITVEPIESNALISIKDSGIGLSEEDIGKLFKPFPGIHHGLDVSSTGLGLSIAKSIVELHGGEIWAESDGLGQGSTFTFTIPL